MNFRKWLLHIYEKTNNAGKETKMTAFVRNQVGRILERSFNHADLKDFYLANANDSQKIQQLRRSAQNFNFFEFISFPEEWKKRFFDLMENWIHIISADNAFSDNGNSLLTRLKEMRAQSVWWLQSKPELENFFSDIYELATDFSVRQNELRSLIRDELNPAKRRVNTVATADSEEFLNFLDAFQDDSDLMKASDRETKKLMFEMHPDYAEFKVAMNVKLDDIRKNFDDWDFKDWAAKLERLLNEDWGEYQKNLLNQMKKLISIIRENNNDEEIPHQAKDILLFNFGSFAECYDDWLLEKIFPYAQSQLTHFGAGYLMEFRFEIRELLLLESCFRKFGIIEPKAKEEFLNILVGKHQISKIAFYFYKKEWFEVDSQKIIEMWKRRIEKIMHTEEPPENIREVQKKLESYAKRTWDRLWFLSVGIFETAIKAGKLMLLSLGALGLALLWLLMQAKRLLADFFIWLSNILGSFAVPIMNIPIPKIITDMLPDSLWLPDMWKDFPNLTLSDLISSILENWAFSKELRNWFNSKWHDIEQDLTSGKKENLSWIRVFNYDRLNSRLLVGETFTEFQGHKWKKEKIDFSSVHVLESYNSKTSESSPADHSFFLERFSWSLEEQSPEAIIMCMSFKILRWWRNSVVCPRWYIPILTRQSRENLANSWISYKLYCVKEFGYFYIDISKKPEYNLEFEFRRYWDEDCNWIFFSWDSGKEKQRLSEPFLTEWELPDDLRLFFEASSYLSDEEFMAACVGFSKENFKYSLTYETTLEHQKHGTHLSWVAHSKVWDCKNVNSLFVWLARMRDIRARILAWYVETQNEMFEWHGITEVDYWWKCKLYDSTPWDHLWDSFNGQSETDKIIERIKDKIDAISEIIKNWASKINFTYIMEKLEEKLSILLAMKITQKKKQLEIFLINKTWWSNILPSISYDLMMLPDPTLLSKHTSMEQYKAFLKTYLSILTSIEYKIKNLDIWYVGNSESVERKKSRMDILRKISDVVWVELHYEAYMQMYFRSVSMLDEMNASPWSTVRQLFWITEVSSVIKKQYFMETLRKLLEMNNMNPNVIEEKLSRLDRILLYLWLEMVHETMVDFKELDNSDFIKCVYLPVSLQEIEEEPMNDWKKHKLLTSDQFSESAKVKEAIQSNLETIYSSIKSWSSRAFEYIDKDNFLCLFQESIDDTLKFPAFNDDVSRKIWWSLPNWKYEWWSFLLDQWNCAPMLRLDILLQLYNGLNTWEINFSIPQNIANMSYQNADYTGFINKEISKLNQIVIYNNKFWKDDFVDKVHLLMAKWIWVSKFDNYLSQKRFLSDPKNIIFVLRLIKSDLDAIDRQSGNMSLNMNITYQNAKTKHDTLTEQKNSLMILRNKLKFILNNAYGDNPGIILDVFNIFWIESKRDKELVMSCLKDIADMRSPEIINYEAAMNILLEGHIRKYSRFENRSDLWGYWIGAELVSRFDLEDSFGVMPWEVLIEIAKNQLAQVKKNQKKERDFFDGLDMAMSEKQAKMFKVLIHSLRYANYANMLDSMKAKSLIYKIEERLNAYREDSYSGLRGL
ncbi:MAG: hypothetical protein ACD_2C00212G0006 [uncultured bacterium (gcode 4)]|uniref:Uncharacterized protein n=1 Tax=uncultured bacterium (gcode 4) TaxID=1234023 RepID=K2FDL3_9BACT|nr:MAG: hypothetical protein ACD_2C00212G0006 [uncultured bacterium (gcode 4)]